MIKQRKKESASEEEWLNMARKDLKDWNDYVLKKWENNYVAWEEDLPSGETLSVYQEAQIYSGDHWYPFVESIFSLTLRPVKSREMLKRGQFSPHIKWTQWQFRGQEISEEQTRNFMLVRIGYTATFSEVRDKLRVYGHIPPGQWIEAFRSFYGLSFGRGKIAVADNSWVDDRGASHFPAIKPTKILLFCKDLGPFKEDWRWLVAVD